MPGTVTGGKKAGQTNKQKYGNDFYQNIGRLGGLKSRGGGFAANPQLAREAGRKGGLKSRKPKLDDMSTQDFIAAEIAAQDKAHKTWRERIGL